MVRVLEREGHSVEGRLGGMAWKGGLGRHKEGGIRETEKGGGRGRENRYHRGL